jgi:hypothetical protein
MPNPLRTRLDRLKPAQIFLMVVVPLFILYFATAARGLPYLADAYTNALTAWSVASRGTIYLDTSPELAQPGHFGRIARFVETPSGHVVSQYPPGTALISLPFYVFHTATTRTTLVSTTDNDDGGITMDVPSFVPAGLAASTTTALAMGFLSLIFVQILSPSRALVAGYIAGLGTGAWAVASNALWQHGPAMFWIALALYLVSKNRLGLAGLGFGMAILTRPHVALIAFAVGVVLGISRRGIRPLLRLGAGSLLGLLALIAYNWMVFQTPSISGGYGSNFTDNVLHSSLLWYVRNIVLALLAPQQGLIVWAPFILVLSFGTVRAWRAAPAWAKGAAIGGVLYLLLQLKANRYYGGDGFFAYRYPLEALTGVAPLLALSWKQWVSKTPLRLRLFNGGVILAIVGQAIGALMY